MEIFVLCIRRLILLFLGYVVSQLALFNFGIGTDTSRKSRSIGPKL
jgi:hypothetical protein